MKLNEWGIKEVNNEKMKRSENNVLCGGDLEGNYEKKVEYVNDGKKEEWLMNK